jgi:hypothetical protein
VTLGLPLALTPGLPLALAPGLPLATTLQPLCLGREPKARVATMCAIILAQTLTLKTLNVAMVLGWFFVC